MLNAKFVLWSRAHRGAFLLIFLAAWSCSNEPQRAAPITQRLVDQLQAENIVSDNETDKTAPMPVEWRFNGSSTVPEGIKVGAGIESVQIQDGRLQGRTTTGFPILRFDLPANETGPGLLHEAQIRLRVSAAGNLSATLLPERGISDSQIMGMAQVLPWTLQIPTVAGGELVTYTLRDPGSTHAHAMRQLVVRPTDKAGTSFEIEFVRLISRREHLATIPSGISWQGLQGVYQETVVSRTSESVHWNLSLPPRPRLEVALGTIEEAPMTFRIHLEDLAESRNGSKNKEKLLLERTVTTPQQWENVAVELDEYAGREVDLRFSLGSSMANLGFWGSPVVRQRGASPRRSTGEPTPRDRVASAPPRGVIFILADTLRADHLDLYGYERATAPTLRRLAEEGAYFEDAIAQASWTQPSAVSMLTSLYPSSHNLKEVSDRLPSTAVTLAEVFREAGWATLGLSSVPFTGRMTNMHQGYEELHEIDFTQGPSKTAREYVDRLLPWLEQHHDVPFFAFLHVFDPHHPYEPRSPFNSLWGDASWHAEHRSDGLAVRQSIADPMLRLTGLPTRQDLLRGGFEPEAYIDREIQWYDGSIRSMDVELSRVMERLGELGIDQDTLIVLVSDHGEEFLEHGRMAHGQSVYGELINVPLLLHYPRGIPANTVVEHTVQLIDLMPTILELCGLPHEDSLREKVVQQMQGQSLLPLITGDRPQGRRIAVSEKAATVHPTTPPPQDTESYALIYDGWKLIHNVKRAEKTAEFELYDHRNDPLDTRDVAREHPDVVEQLSGYLEAWHEEVERHKLSTDQEMENLNQEQLERLRALGYLE